jgi:hypothetical protein
MSQEVIEQLVSTFAEPDRKNTEVFDVDYKFESQSTPQTIDFKDKFDLFALSKECYTLGKDTKIDYPRLLSDLQRVLIYCDGLYGFKQIDSDKGGIETFRVVWHSEKDAQQQLNKLYVGKRKNKETGKVKPVSVWTVLLDNGNLAKHFQKRRICFYSPDPVNFSFFHGYKYNVLPESQRDSTKYEKFCNHILNVLCGGNQVQYEYMQDWISMLMQNPIAKIGTAPVINAKPGVGKNKAFSDIIDELLDGYSTTITNLDDVIGTFNAIVENKKLIIGNELSSYDANKFLNRQPLKARITDTKMVINDKNIKKRSDVDDYSNYMFISNNNDSIKVDDSDRRYVFIDAVNTYAPMLHGKINPLHAPYFDALFAEIHAPGFYNQLYTYYMTRDISRFEPSKIPAGTARTEALEFSKSAIECFIERYVAGFQEGFPCDTATENFNDWAPRNGFNKMTATKFGLKIKEFCDIVRPRTSDGRRQRCYKLKSDMLERFPVDDDDDVAIESL